MDPNRLALFEMKLLSHGKVTHIPYKIHIHMLLYDTTCNCKHHLKKINDSRLFLNV